MGHHGRESLVYADWLITGQSAWALVVALGPHEVGFGGLVLRRLLSVGMGEAWNRAGQTNHAPHLAIRVLEVALTLALFAATIGIPCKYQYVRPCSCEPAKESHD